MGDSGGKFNLVFCWQRYGRDWVRSAGSARSLRSRLCRSIVNKRTGRRGPHPKGFAGIIAVRSFWCAGNAHTHTRAHKPDTRRFHTKTPQALFTCCLFHIGAFYFFLKGGTWKYFAFLWLHPGLFHLFSFAELDDVAFKSFFPESAWKITFSVARRLVCIHYLEFHL